MSMKITMQAGVPQEFYGVSNFIRILDAAAPLTLEFYFQGREVAEALDVLEGYAEKFELGQFDRVRLTSATTQQVQFVTRLGNSVLYDKAPVGDSIIIGSVPLALDAATLAALELQRRPALPSGAWVSNATAVANTPLTVFTPGANVNGAILWQAGAVDVTASVAHQVFIAKASVPATIIDGDVIAQSMVTAVTPGVNVITGIDVRQPCRIAPGLGLYFVSGFAGTSAMVRSARYTLL